MVPDGIVCGPCDPLRAPPAIRRGKGQLVSPAEPTIVVEHREALVYLLCEACELEYGLMAEYLFAAFSLKQAGDEGLTAEQAEAVERWRKAILGVAAQEMLHLALANNLLSALGHAPHLERPNVPQRAKHYPPGVQLPLLPFGEQAIRHFLFPERPEGMDLEDAEGFEALEAAVPLVEEDDLAVHGPEFRTVGHLYRSIEAGLRHLVERFWEEWVFVGPSKAQATPETFRWPELVTVTDLASACIAIQTIVEQGEGPRGDWRDAHYGRSTRSSRSTWRSRPPIPASSRRCRSSRSASALPRRPRSASSSPNP